MMSFKERRGGQQDGSGGEGTCHKAWCPEYSLQDPQCGRRTDCHLLSSDLHTHCGVGHYTTQVYAGTLQAHKINKMHIDIF